MVQRIFLPQHRKEFFEARANDGIPGFFDGRLVQGAENCWMGDLM